MDRKIILNAIYNSIDEINETLPKSRHLKKEENTPIFGAEGNLDSLALVNFIVCTEDYLADEYDVDVTLADEKAMSQHNSPFRSVSAFADYIQSLVD